MANYKPDKTLFTILVVGLIVVALYTSGFLHDIGLLSPTSFAETGQPAGEVHVVGDCPAYEDASFGGFMVTSILTTSGTETAIASQNMKVYKEGATMAYDTITSSSSAYAFSTSGSELTCGDVFKVIVGDGSTYYLADNINDGNLWEGTRPEPTWMSADGYKTTAKFVVDKVGTFSVKGSNGTSFQVADTAVVKNRVHTTMAAGATSTDIELTVAENGGAVLRQPAFCIDYNTTGFDEISIIGGREATSIPLSHSAADKCYIGPYNRIENYGKQTYGVKVVAHSGTGYNPSNQTVTVYVVDLATYNNDGVIYDGWTNPTAPATDIGATDATYRFQVM